MANLDVLTYGLALTSDQGALGYSTNSLLTVGNNNILVDTGPSSRRSVLYRALQDKNLTPDDVDIMILTHMHWDHCQNTGYVSQRPHFAPSNRDGLCPQLKSARPHGGPVHGRHDRQNEGLSRESLGLSTKGHGATSPHSRSTTP